MTDECVSTIYNRHVVPYSARVVTAVLSRTRCLFPSSNCMHTPITIFFLVHLGQRTRPQQSKPGQRVDCKVVDRTRLPFPRCSVCPVAKPPVGEIQSRHSKFVGTVALRISWLFGGHQELAERSRSTSSSSLKMSLIHALSRGMMPP
jgi:hypothetical protein